MAETKASDNPGVSGVAGRYASALFELAREERAIDTVGRDLDRFSALIDGSDDLQRLIKSPVFSADEQEKAIGSILDKAGIGGIAGSLIRLVAQKRRLFVLPGIMRDFRALVAHSKGIVPAEVRLAEAPSSKVLDDIKAAVREMAGSDVDLNVKIDPSLIGGLVVKVGSRMVDASLKTKLNAIRVAMKEAR
ncbi:F0F1 ATP synthase subunit delta [Enterovirga rhinocerotis]|uniref:F0F1 ATP synthase subunit delta n=1 Tax=Enterovirga rhinocerotis TaxID=1339210 RepID=UPI001FE0F376|nr:F0F1 ATP synthase subunit delta [Enterovirga rhinocerotis]